MKFQSRFCLEASQFDNRLKNEAGKLVVVFLFNLIQIKFSFFFIGISLLLLLWWLWWLPPLRNLVTGRNRGRSRSPSFARPASIILMEVTALGKLSWFTLSMMIFFHFFFPCESSHGQETCCLTLISRAKLWIMYTHPLRELITGNLC